MAQKSMTDRPTPQTDAEVTSYFEKKHPLIVCYHELAKFARGLERERDEARDATEKAKAFKRVMKEDNARLRHELDELNKRLAEASSLGVDLLIQREQFRREFAAERALADRLADSLTACERWVNQSCDVKTAANKALMEWKEARK